MKLSTSIGMASRASKAIGVNRAQLLPPLAGYVSRTPLEITNRPRPEAFSKVHKRPLRTRSPSPGIAVRHEAVIKEAFHIRAVRDGMTAGSTLPPWFSDAALDDAINRLSSFARPINALIDKLQEQKNSSIQCPRTLAQLGVLINGHNLNDKLDKVTDYVGTNFPQWQDTLRSKIGWDWNGLDESYFFLRFLAQKSRLPNDVKLNGSAIKKICLASSPGSTQDQYNVQFQAWVRDVVAQGPGTAEWLYNWDVVMEGYDIWSEAAIRGGDCRAAESAEVVAVYDCDVEMVDAC